MMQITHPDCQHITYAKCIVDRERLHVYMKKPIVRITDHAYDSMTIVRLTITFKDKQTNYAE